MSLSTLRRFVLNTEMPTQIPLKYGWAVLGKFTLVRCPPVLGYFATSLASFMDIQIILGTWKGRI